MPKRKDLPWEPWAHDARVSYVIVGKDLQIRMAGRTSEWCKLLPVNDVDATVRQLMHELGARKHGTP
jgi:hypothetical protein